MTDCNDDFCPTPTRAKWAIFTELDSGLKLVLCPIGHWEVANICAKPLLFDSEAAAQAKTSELSLNIDKTYAAPWQEQKLEGLR